MKIKEGFNIRQLCGENIVVAEGEANIDFSVVISVNETAAHIWKAVAGKDFTVEDMADSLLAEYEVDKETALADCKALAEKWQEVGILE
ncbi:MAG: PqqD family protein [Bacteroidaceae bacterium]|nr:PqqD family protein [Bacteroidaceae bacterium]